MTRIVRSRAPILRLGIAGGGTDISPYCDEFTGYVLNATIDRYAYCTIEATTDNIVHFFAADRATEITCTLDSYPFAIDNSLDLHKATYNRIVKEFNHNQPISVKKLYSFLMLHGLWSWCLVYLGCSYD